MRRGIQTSVIAVVVMTIVFGLIYPLAVTGVSQLLFHDKATGSRVEQDGKFVGSRLIAQSFGRQIKGEHGREADRSYFQSRPSQTDYDPSVTFFSNLGPNSVDERDAVKDNLDAYLKLERRYDSGLTAADVPIDAVTQSASGVDPHISEANARIQARRVAKVRDVPLSRVLSLVDDNTDGRFLGLFGEPGVNVLELNLALDKEAPTT